MAALSPTSSANAGAAPTCACSRRTSSRNDSMLDRARHRQHERLELERLGEKVVGAGADGGDRRIDAAKGGDEHHRHVGAIGDDALAQLEAVHAAHVEVGDDDVEVGGGERGERGVGAVGELDGVATAAEPAGEKIAHAGVVLDDEQPRLHAAASTSGRWMAKQLPRPGSLSAEIQPPCSRTRP